MMQLAEHASAAQREAWSRWQSFDFKREENWRWTPSEALFTAREPVAADYEFSLAEPVQDDWGEDAPPADLPRDLPLAQANYALLREALFLNIEGQSEEISSLALRASGQQWQSSRLHAQWQPGAEAALWLDYAVQDGAAQNGVIHLHLAAEAVADVVLYLQGAEQAAQHLTVFVEQAAGSQLKLNIVQAEGSALQRVDVRARLQGEEADFKLGGLQVLRGSQVADVHVLLRHESPHCTSQQLVRGALHQQSLGCFDGMIYVDKIAQKTDAQQDSRYILQQAARSQSIPRLEIYADDVQCAHGSTTGELDAEALFYLQSRGIATETARNMLLGGFLQEAVIIEQENLRAQLLQVLAGLGYGEVLEA